MEQIYDENAQLDQVSESDLLGQVPGGSVESFDTVQSESESTEGQHSESDTKISGDEVTQENVKSEEDVQADEETEPLKIEVVAKCAECGDVEGVLITCEGCKLMYHNECLLEAFRPKVLAGWTCPQCQWKESKAAEAVPKEESEAQQAVPVVKNGRPGRSSMSPSRVPEDVAERKRKKPASEGSNFATKINIGFNHQVPFTPAFFLDDSYNSRNTRHEWARLMYSPYQLEKIRRRKIQEGCQDAVVKNEFELANFIQMCAKSWKNSPGWHPFSPEFAYKILHFADYDPNKALKFMNDPNFNFSCVCDPPTRRYDNKWKPKDRRGQVPTSPYPPPVTLRGYLLRRHTVSANKQNT
ncbi:hypothetical protein BEWA_026230 [Theileria equi strain WA]|uniref:PHD-type domain-containing protein n=1 Tax=Theileria equi strain WA TaxID=1537102 RepID=L0AXY4_THEEQ|nr:hypothetical protein BEWA_026230 [Theileria equi strain WA]AFZ79774.1 hypothetical protein BEWA_026230 [Theileria equi strain WA]|eukprot:XP_004829440.1 hypothetical protein BEWA_026230 [Theileria equi strain WA]